MAKWAIAIFAAAAGVVTPIVAGLRSTEAEARPAQAEVRAAPSPDPAAFGILQTRVEQLSGIAIKLEALSGKLDKLDDRVRDVQMDVAALKARTRSSRRSNDE